MAVNSSKWLVRPVRPVRPVLPERPVQLVRLVQPVQPVLLVWPVQSVPPVQPVFLSLSNVPRRFLNTFVAWNSADLFCRPCPAELSWSVNSAVHI